MCADIYLQDIVEGSTPSALLLWGVFDPGATAPGYCCGFPSGIGTAGWYIGEFLRGF